MPFNDHNYNHVRAIYAQSATEHDLHIGQSFAGDAFMRVQNLPEATQKREEMLAEARIIADSMEEARARYGVRHPLDAFVDFDPLM